MSEGSHQHTATCISSTKIWQTLERNSKIRARKPLPAMPGTVGSDWLPARPWTGGGVPMGTVTIGVEGSAHPSKRAYLAIFASPIPYAFFGKVENCIGQADNEVGELEAARL